MKLPPEVFWRGLSRADQNNLFHGVYDDKFPALKKVCMPVIADEIFAETVGHFIAVDTNKTDS